MVTSVAAFMSPVLPYRYPQPLTWVTEPWDRRLSSHVKDCGTQALSGP